MNSPTNAFVSGNAIFANAIITNKMVNTGALCANPPNSEIFLVPNCFSIKSITIHKPMILIPWANICITIPSKATVCIVKMAALINPICAMDE